jgi:hypothetical protein
MIMQMYIYFLILFAVCQELRIMCMPGLHGTTYDPPQCLTQRPLIYSLPDNDDQEIITRNCAFVGDLLQIVYKFKFCVHSIQISYLFEQGCEDLRLFCEARRVHEQKSLGN